MSSKNMHAQSHHVVAIGQPPQFIGRRYRDGSITLEVVGVDESTDGVTLFTFTPLLGVEFGISMASRRPGQPEIVRFKGTLEEQREVFEHWSSLATENERPTIFEEEGLDGLARLDELPMPLLPPIAEAGVQ